MYLVCCGEINDKQYISLDRTRTAAARVATYCTAFVPKKVVILVFYIPKKQLNRVLRPADNNIFTECYLVKERLAARESRMTHIYVYTVYVYLL